MVDIVEKLTDFFQDIGDINARTMDMLKNRNMQILIIIIFVIFFSISVLIYIKIIHPKINPTYVDNREFVRDNQDETMIVMWFYTQWCPYCKSTYGQWEGFKADAQLKNFPISVEFREIDCEVETNICDKYNIQEYPSIRIVYKGDVYIYDAKPDRMELMNFLNGSIPENINENINMN